MLGLRQLPCPGRKHRILMNNKEIVVFSTCPDAIVGGAIARSLVERRHAACVNLVPGVSSVYRWEGQTREDKECLLVIKTTTDRFDELADHVSEKHPYELPELVAVPVSAGSAGYLDWIRTCVADGC